MAALAKYRNEDSVLFTTANVGSNVKNIIEHAVGMLFLPINISLINVVFDVQYVF